MLRVGPVPPGRRCEWAERRGTSPGNRGSHASISALSNGPISRAVLVRVADDQLAPPVLRDHDVDAVAVQPRGFPGDPVFQTSPGSGSPGTRRNGGASGLRPASARSSNRRRTAATASSAACSGRVRSDAAGPGTGSRISSPEQTQTLSASIRPLREVTTFVRTSTTGSSKRNSTPIVSRNQRQIGDDLARIDADLRRAPQREEETLLPHRRGGSKHGRRIEQLDRLAVTGGHRRRIPGGPGPRPRGRPGAQSPRACARSGRRDRTSSQIARLRRARSRISPNGWPIGQSMPKLRTEAPDGDRIPLEDDHAASPLRQVVGMRQPEDAGPDDGVVAAIRSLHARQPRSSRWIVRVMPSIEPTPR